MITFSKQRAALFVDRSCQQWIVRDPEGNFWLLPSVENHWGQRQAFHPTAETELELVPGYYTYMLPDLHEEDIAGSGFALTGYRVHQALRGDVALVRLRERLRQCGLRLMLDVVPDLRGPGLRCGPMGSGRVCHDACPLSPVASAGSGVAVAVRLEDCSPQRRNFWHDSHTSHPPQAQAPRLGMGPKAKPCKTKVQWSTRLPFW